MASNKPYSTRARKAQLKSDSISSSLFDELLSQKDSGSPKAPGKRAWGSGGKAAGASTGSMSRSSQFTYKYSYSSRSSVSATHQKSTPPKSLPATSKTSPPISEGTATTLAKEPVVKRSILGSDKARKLTPKNTPASAKSPGEFLSIFDFDDLEAAPASKRPAAPAAARRAQTSTSGTQPAAAPSKGKVSTSAQKTSKGQRQNGTRSDDLPGPVQSKEAECSGRAKGGRKASAGKRKSSTPSEATSPKKPRIHIVKASPVKLPPPVKTGPIVSQIATRTRSTTQALQLALHNTDPTAFSPDKLVWDEFEPQESKPSRLKSLGSKSKRNTDQRLQDGKAEMDHSESPAVKALQQPEAAVTKPKASGDILSCLDAPMPESQPHAQSDTPANATSPSSATRNTDPPPENEMEYFLRAEVSENPLPSSSSSTAGPVKEQGSSKPEDSSPCASDSETTDVEADLPKIKAAGRGCEPLEEAPDLSLSEPATLKAFHHHFDRHLDVPSLKKSSSGLSSPLKYSTSASKPSLQRCSTWPKPSTESSKTKSLKTEKELLHTRVRNVRQAHECLELGESQQFFDDINYLLDNIKPEQPLNIRCLGACNLALQCLNTDFTQLVRAHGFTAKITEQLTDAPEHPSLCLSSAVLFYVMTQDKYSSDWNREGVDLLVQLLKVNEHSFGSDLNGKAARELDKIKIKAKSILDKVVEKVQSRRESFEIEPDSESRSKREDFVVDTSTISITELVCECIVSLTLPQHNPGWLREELRSAGGLDIFANSIIGGCKELEGVAGCYDQDNCSVVERKLRVLARQLQVLENVSMHNKDNQSYLIVFDGSLLVSTLTRFVPVCHKFVAQEPLRLVAQELLLAVFKALLNLTHDSEFGSHRVGEQQGVMEALLDTIFKLPVHLPEGDQFDILVLSLGLLINLTENSAANRKCLEAAQVCVEDMAGVASGSLEDYHRNSSLKALIGLFLKHYSKAESASIEVPTPQRLSQLSSSPHSSPLRPSQGKADPTPSFSDRMKNLMQKSPVKSQRSPRKCGDRAGDEANVSGEDSDSETEEFEHVEIDPLVFSREEFDSALSQAGRHMEDSIVASYTGLLLGLLARHNQYTADVVKDGMPSKSFSEMIAILRKFVSFMNITGTSGGGGGMESIRRIIKYLEAL